MQHGTISGYTGLGCREECCRAAFRKYMKTTPAGQRNQAANAERRKLQKRIRRQTIWERDQGICGLCGESADPSDWHMDHIIPYSLGGPTTVENLQVSCPPCNMRKKNRLLAS